MTLELTLICDWCTTPKSLPFDGPDVPKVWAPWRVVHLAGGPPRAFCSDRHAQQWNEAEQKTRPPSLGSVVVPPAPSPRQQPLFGDPRTHARSSDPDTSHEAAEKVKLAEQALAVLWSYADGEALTDHEAYKRAFGEDTALARQRCSDLRRRGFIEWTGDWGMTPLNRRARLHRITQAGRDYLAQHAEKPT